MKKHIRSIACAVFCLLFIQLPLIADTKKKKEDHTPVPYTKAEFPLWSRELRRFEILTFGALPFVTMLSFWSYDIIRSIQHPKDPQYYPWPIKKADKALPLTEKEQRNIFLTAVGISVGIALTDIIYRAVRREIRKKRLERENLFVEDPIQFIPTTKPFETERDSEPENTEETVSEEEAANNDIESKTVETLTQNIIIKPKLTEINTETPKEE